MHASLSWSASATALATALAAVFCGVAAKDLEQHSPCTEDAMIVFDASGSMSGNGWGYGSETAGTVSRIDKVRSTLAKILPQVTRSRRVGLITHGPGVWNQCNVHLDLPPTEHAASRIMTVVNALTPAGKTPLTEAVAQAAEVLDFRVKPGLIVIWALMSPNDPKADSAKVNPSFQYPAASNSCLKSLLHAEPGETIFRTRREHQHHVARRLSERV